MADDFGILDGTVEELKEALEEFDGDLEALLEAEQDGKDRKTAIEAIEREMEEREETGDASGDDDTDKDKDADADAADSDDGSGFAGLKDSIEESLDRGDDDEDSEDGGAGGFSHDKELHVTSESGREFIATGIPGFDDLFDHGVPKDAPVLLAGGSGAGKTIFGLQTLAHHAANGDKCFYMSFEESEEALKQHMRDFGWDPDTMIEEGNLRIEKFSPFDITRKVEAALAKEQGELMIDIDPVILPQDFDPDFIVVDSLTAVASAFTEDRSSYRIYLDQLFDFFKDIGANSFLITETDQEPEQFSPTGVEEFLADGVIVLYNFRRGDSRESAIEVLKMRGESHDKKIVAMQITDEGITVYPDQQVFGAMG
jgi:KaiC/GvpD/RAD55 family RecA-like ATPase